MPQNSWVASLMFPFRTDALLAICILTVIYTFTITPFGFAARTPIIFSPCFLVAVIFIMLVAQGYFWHLLFQVMRTAAYNEPDLPVTADWDPEGIIHDLLTAIGATLMSFVPLIVYTILQHAQFLLDHPVATALLAFLGVLNLPLLMLITASSLPSLIPSLIAVSPAVPWLVMFLAIIGLCYLPMALLASVLHQTIRAAQPWHVIPAMFRVKWAYLGTLLLVVGVAGLSAFFQWLAEYVPILGVFLTWFIVLTGHTAVMHRLGAMYYEHRHALSWFPDSPRAY